MEAKERRTFQHRLYGFRNNQPEAVFFVENQQS
jgi:hypothetical protein